MVIPKEIHDKIRPKSISDFIDAYMQQTPDKTLIGVDVCGEDPEADSEEVQAVCRETSEKISSFVMTLFKAD